MTKSESMMPDIDEIDIKKTLAVFDVITTLGQKEKLGYRYNGLLAMSDYDGYNLTIKNDYVELNIYFHNKFSFKYSNKKEKLLFLQKINDIYQSKKNARKQ